MMDSGDQAMEFPAGQGRALSMGDARRGKLAGNLVGFCRALRRAGLRVDTGQMALAQQALQLVGLERRADVAATLESILVHEESHRVVFREMFDAYFQDPQVANKLLAQLLPRSEGRAEVPRRRPRVADALAPLRAAHAPPPTAARESKVEIDVALTASDRQRLRQADFQSLGAAEFRWVERQAREMRFDLPRWPSRRAKPGVRGPALHWPRLIRAMAQRGGDAIDLPRRARRMEPLPLLLLIDVSGSMERYARILLAFLHAATRHHPRRSAFAFGTRLTDLSVAFAHDDPDDMLAEASLAMRDFAGGTRMGECLAQMRSQHVRHLVGRRTMVLMITDGLDTGEPGTLSQELVWLRRHCRELCWLNPMLRFEGYRPLARGAAALQACSTRSLAVHNLEHLGALSSSLKRLLAQ